MKVPYAKSDFPSIRNEGNFFVDKTPYIARLEDVSEGQLVYLRPRRFGKSTLLSMLASYYDIAAAGDFDKLFGGLWIHEHPTPKKNAYLPPPINRPRRWCRRPNAASPIPTDNDTISRAMYMR